MNTKQTAALKYLTNRIYDANKMMSGENCNGDIANHIIPCAGDVIMLSASNVESKRWFETSIHVIAYIGTRGGIQVKLCDGVSRFLIK